MTDVYWGVIHGALAVFTALALHSLLGKPWKRRLLARRRDAEQTEFAAPAEPDAQARQAERALQQWARDGVTICNRCGEVLEPPGTLHCPLCDRRDESKALLEESRALEQQDFKLQTAKMDQMNSATERARGCIPADYRREDTVIPNTRLSDARDGIRRHATREEAEEYAAAERRRRERAKEEEQSDPKRINEILRDLKNMRG